ncbi:hypothetical protein [Cerasicoccus frondis]|uniref:hypothetical protein n=1 Tax=Cerasicoccus frondis TaxID=490090 RepID=UPI002852D65F|nr:hypothetical protein [Cerasicoccus frondis]
MLPPNVSRAQIVLRGLTNRCPNCGGRSIFRSWFRLHYRCPRCGLKLSRSDGFFLGAVVWNYGLTVFGCLPPLFILHVLGVISLTTLGVLGVIIGIVVPPVIYPWAWSLWLMTYYWALPHELPANAGADPSVDEDE